ncbi:MAG: UDP-2,3-diacylglucosamine diphosphatase [Halioglobus sp.]|nr:UDP-2,3-diacylglucosamine diphosphatase [Halioglobus sp.]MCB1709923.1 UDP-2,3-diacylglucosamine diphosphatase [Halioglobus sp.]MCP5123120.1 UDP-2,3-diacylglucosamine diphosphatase [Pseudomonadales bacterium]MCP5192765.1 UDP-2,3-diacylglucosamine diphosphatase [Pseudomonadales bacterium]
MSSTCFISDLHLDPARPAVTRALAGYLDRHRQCDQLYILGDLFEAWPGDDDDSPLAARVLRLLRDFSAAGPGLFIMPGNRDFLLGRRFCDAAGASLLPDPTVIDLYGEPTLLMHGDSLCTLDSDYQQFRRTARDPAWQSQLLAQPLAQRRALATRLRAMSREAGSMKSEDIMDVTPAEVDRAMAAHGARQLIHGHTHRPARHESPAGLRWVLGAWEQCGWAIEAKIDEIDLMNFNIYQ